MIYLVIILIGLGIIVGMFTMLTHKEGDETSIVSKDTCATCNGENTKCEQECMMEAATKPIEYFDDEELDRYAGRQDDEYTDSEADEFREVLYTMRQEEVADWSRSLILRNVNLPRQLRDEVIMLIGDTDR